MGLTDSGTTLMFEAVETRLRFWQEQQAMAASKDDAEGIGTAARFVA